MAKNPDKDDEFDPFFVKPDQLRSDRRWDLERYDSEVEEVLRDTEDETEITIICQGAPRCEFIGSHAMKVAARGCIWCQRIYTFAGEREEKIEPGHA